MKWALYYVLVVLYMFSVAVNGVKTKEILTLGIDPLNYGADQYYLKAGLSKKIVCKGSTKTQKVEWYDPRGRIVTHHPKSRIHIQESFVPSFRNALRSQVLSIGHASVADSGVWECRSGDLRQNMSLCVIDPVKFLDTKTEVTVDVGRSITLSCHARGDPEPSIVWLRNGEILNITNDELSTKYKMMTSYKSQGIEGLLTVTSLDPYDSGIYKCVAIQENLLAEDCGTVDSLNITLNVNFGPVFRGDNDSEFTYYARNNESIELVCEARAFPTPTYRWFHEKGDEILSEISEKQIRVLDDGNKAALPMVAGPSTFNEKYRCKASNQYGDAYMRFKIAKLEKPLQPNEISVQNFTDSEIEFLVLWDDEKPYYPVDSVDIQYMRKKIFGTPREFHWRNSKTVEIVKDNPYKITDLDEETEYWARFRWSNKAGNSGWSAPILASTGTKLAPPEEQERTNDKNQVPESEDTGYSGIFYGVFSTGVVIIVSVTCIYVIKRV